METCKVMLTVSQVGIAILNDSWQMMSATNHAMSFPALAPARTILHDMVSMAICLGGLVLVVFTGVGTGTTDGYELQQAVDYPQYGETFTLRRLMNAAHWFLMAVMYEPPSVFAHHSHPELIWQDCGGFSLRCGGATTVCRLRRPRSSGGGTVDRWRRPKCTMLDAIILMSRER